MLNDLASFSLPSPSMPIRKALSSLLHLVKMWTKSLATLFCYTWFSHVILGSPCGLQVFCE